MRVVHKSGNYEVEPAALSDALARLPADRVVITDEIVWGLWGGRFGASERVFAVPAGEPSKSIAQFQACLEWMASRGATRRTAVVAFGGGVVGDLAGFVAASYMRGVPLIMIPSTLLSQVDSSVGGKVGVDLAAGKNLAGAFHHPQHVWLCLDLLATLGERQFRNGLAEVVKYGFIMDPDLLDLCPASLNVSSNELPAIVQRCVALKAQVVEEDERETTGRRAILNFGHTIGHAIEHATGYGPVLHGEAVSIGMVVEARLGERIGVTQPGTAQRVRAILGELGLPTTLPQTCGPHELLDAMRRDKKRHGEGLAFSLLTEVGTCKLVEGVPESEAQAALQMA